MAFGATTQDLHSEPLCETSTVETVATRPDSVAQNAFTANKTHVSDTLRCSARHCKACPSEHLPVRFAGLPLGLLETCDQHLGEILFSVSTMVTHVGQKQFVHNWTAQASNANQVLLPTREGLIHLFFRNQQVSLGDTAPQRRLSVRRHQCARTSSRKRRVILGVDGPIGIAVIVPISVLFRRGLLASVDSSDFQCCGFGLLPLRRSSFVGSQEVIPRTAPSMGGSEAELQSAAPNQ